MLEESDNPNDELRNVLKSKVFSKKSKKYIYNTNGLHAVKIGYKRKWERIYHSRQEILQYFLSVEVRASGFTVWTRGSDLVRYVWKLKSVGKSCGKKRERNEEALEFNALI